MGVKACGGGGKGANEMTSVRKIASHAKSGADRHGVLGGDEHNHKKCEVRELHKNEAPDCSLSAA